MILFQLFILPLVNSIGIDDQLLNNINEVCLYQSSPNCFVGLFVGWLRAMEKNQKLCRWLILLYCISIILSGDTGYQNSFHYSAFQK
jgi:hypothetical protein